MVRPHPNIYLYLRHHPTTQHISVARKQLHTAKCKVYNGNLQPSHLSEFFSINKGTASDHGVVWNAYKAYIRGLLIKLSSLHKKRRTQRIDELTTQIATLEQQHKTNPQNPITHQLFNLRQELKTLLLHSFEYLQSRIKATSYATSNKAGKLLATKLRGKRLKTKISQIIHPHTNIPQSNPQDIANTFSDYYSDLYNLKQDTKTPQPSPEEINLFLQSIQLPTLNEKQRNSISSLQNRKFSHQ